MNSMRGQIDALTQVAFVEGPDGHLAANRELVGRDAAVLGERIGLRLDSSLRMLIGETDANHVFVREEQMMPFLPIVRVPNIDQAIREAVISEHGYGHTGRDSFAQHRKHAQHGLRRRYHHFRQERSFLRRSWLGRRGLGDVPPSPGLRARG